MSSEKEERKMNGSKLTPEVDRVFQRLDAHGDGKLSSEKISEAMTKLDTISPEEIKWLVAELDGDGDGVIGYDDFEAFCLKFLWGPPGFDFYRSWNLVAHLLMIRL
ncbi:hypothetical protein IEQ34_001278 [Dendrobium chrysotoxum]|uniref:EF-hand domain-containing protein n=1 Tax=Dendrobium chrysotoxum TaxID=161865 RepID=A0AAV7HNN5_DENCH|nr:hypothetical protein IEQ34_001278 [Dendrobium chrysotoxum]